MSKLFFLLVLISLVALTIAHYECDDASDCSCGAAVCFCCKHTDARGLNSHCSPTDDSDTKMTCK